MRTIKKIMCALGWHKWTRHLYRPGLGEYPRNPRCEYHYECNCCHKEFTEQLLNGV